MAQSGTFVFSGRGWGHGVGLSQWGAKAMAEKGMKCGEILGHYFPGTKISK
jgi:stage II sporulation protein D